MVPCKSCKKFHDLMLNCRVAENQLKAGTLAEPYLTANRLEDLKARKISESPVVTTVPNAEAVQAQKAEKDHVKGSSTLPPVPASAPKWKTREEYNAYMREYMRVWRAKK